MTFTLNDVRTEGPKLPSRIMLHGVEGVGKTTLAAGAPKPIFLQAQGETGVESLLDYGRLNEVAYLPELFAWGDLIGAIAMLLKEAHDFKTLVLDTINGFERLCMSMVCEKHYNGDWGAEGFLSYGKGIDTTCNYWRELLALLDKVRKEKRMAIIALCHTRISHFENPSGADFDRYTPALNKKIMELTKQWADHIFFMNYNVDTEKQAGKTKGRGGNARVIHTQWHAAYEAKTRSGVPAKITLPDGHSKAYEALASAIRDSKDLK